jgi:hypothetical protein
MGRKALRIVATRRIAPGAADTFVDLVRNLAKTLFDPYRPELHYMRGPGPKWHAKHDPAATAMHAVPVLARIRVKA